MGMGRATQKSIRFLRNHCSEFLSDMEKEGVRGLLWRGCNEESVKEFQVIEPVFNRRPRNNSQQIHKLADDWFLDKFGYRYRSAALFSTGNPSIASSYGTVYGVFPIGAYTVCWSPSIKDLYTEISLSFLSEIDSNSIDEVLSHGDYCEGNLAEAIRSGCEVMLASPSGFALVEIDYSKLSPLVYNL